MNERFFTSAHLIDVTIQLLGKAIWDEYGTINQEDLREGEPECMDAIEALMTARGFLRKYMEVQQSLPF